MPTPEGTLPWRPLLDALDLVAPSIAEAARAGALPSARVAPIDATLADTEAFCAAYDVALESSANCIVVQARRGETTTVAAVLVLATDRADINKTVRKHLGARKITFAAHEDTEAAAGMESGGITPVGLPEEWPILVDQHVVDAGPVVIGGGVRGSKILVPGVELATLPSAEVLALTLD
ncbi:YbaK/EbsC family protein [Gordonia sp. CPCC 205515]|uniref:YbaK/EbsC family protein n=1 Tax=Gordonia sp. CPCC 205515 TaxID=3140791 RepID=UPI003AF398A3